MNTKLSTFVRMIFTFAIMLMTIVTAHAVFASDWNGPVKDYNPPEGFSLAAQGDDFSVDLGTGEVIVVSWDNDPKWKSGCELEKGHVFVVNGNVDEVPWTSTTCPKDPPDNETRWKEFSFGGGNISFSNREDSGHGYVYYKPAPEPTSTNTPDDPTATSTATPFETPIDTSTPTATNQWTPSPTPVLTSTPGATNTPEEPKVCMAEIHIRDLNAGQVIETSLGQKTANEQGEIDVWDLEGFNVGLPDLGGIWTMFYLDGSSHEVSGTVHIDQCSIIKIVYTPPSPTPEPSPTPSSTPDLGPKPPLCMAVTGVVFDDESNMITGSISGRGEKWRVVDQFGKIVANGGGKFGEFEFKGQRGTQYHGEFWSSGFSWTTRIACSFTFQFQQRVQSFALEALASVSDGHPEYAGSYLGTITIGDQETIPLYEGVIGNDGRLELPTEGCAQFGNDIRCHRIQPKLWLKLKFGMEAKIVYEDGHVENFSLGEKSLRDYSDQLNGDSLNIGTCYWDASVGNWGGIESYDLTP